MSEVVLSAVQTGDTVLGVDGRPMKVLVSYMDGHGPSAVWCVEGYAEGKPTSRIRGNPETTTVEKL